MHGPDAMVVEEVNLSLGIDVGRAALFEGDAAGFINAYLRAVAHFDDDGRKRFALDIREKESFEITGLHPPILTSRQADQQPPGESAVILIEPSMIRDTPQFSREAWLSQGIKG